MISVSDAILSRKSIRAYRKEPVPFELLNEILETARRWDLGVKPEEVSEMESRLSGSDLGFDGFQSDDDDNHTAPIAYLTHDSADPAQTLEAADWSSHNQAKLAQALTMLDERSRDILQRRWLTEPKETLHTLADEYGVSAERIRQIEKNAMNKLQGAMAA
ncbi:MAG TPA: sigma-70 family RNA polymerase sigma factor [Gammaproteobacteria bacterium]|nr:sigma-70 family RNA polymerase sigma factor [Gammaproteobacteria bacterium]